VVEIGISARIAAMEQELIKWRKELKNTFEQTP
jgi:hypothetical protein